MARVMPSQVVQTIDELFPHAAKTDLATCSLVARCSRPINVSRRLYGFDTYGRRHR